MKKKSKSKPAKKAIKKATTKASGKARTKNAVGMVPKGDRVLVKPQPVETVTSFGIIIPDTAREKPEQGIVVAVGEGKRSEDGKLMAISLKVGDKVLFSKYGYDEVKVDGVEYYLVREDNILAILN